MHVEILWPEFPGVASTSLDEDGLPRFDFNFYAINKKSKYGGASMLHCSMSRKDDYEIVDSIVSQEDYKDREEKEVEQED